jgi:hypothetical protein
MSALIGVLPSLAEEEDRGQGMSCNVMETAQGMLYTLTLQSILA